MWIRRNLSTASTVYALPERLDKHCIGAEPMLDKKPGSRKSGRSAHPVLWICRWFSTVGLVFRVNLSFCVLPAGWIASVSRSWSRLWLRRMRLVLSVDKMDVEQCLPYVETLTGATTIKKLRHRCVVVATKACSAFFFFFWGQQGVCVMKGGP